MTPKKSPLAFTGEKELEALYFLAQKRSLSLEEKHVAIRKEVAGLRDVLLQMRLEPPAEKAVNSGGSAEAVVSEIRGLQEERDLALQEMEKNTAFCNDYSKVMEQKTLTLVEKMYECFVHLHEKIAEILAARSKAVQELQFILATILKMEKSLDAFEEAHEQTVAEKERLAAELKEATVEKECAFKELKEISHLREGLAKELKEMSVHKERLSQELSTSISEKMKLSGDFKRLSVENENVQEDFRKAVLERSAIARNLGEMCWEKENLRRHSQDITKEKESLERNLTRVATEKQLLGSEVKKLTMDKERLEMEMERLCMRRESLERDVVGLLEQKESLWKQLEYSLAEKESLAKEKESMANELVKREGLATEIRRVYAEKEKLSVQLKMVAAEKEILDLELQQAVSDKGGLMSDLKIMESEKEYLENKLREYGYGLDQRLQQQHQQQQQQIEQAIVASTRLMTGYPVDICVEFRGGGSDILEVVEVPSSAAAAANDDDDILNDYVEDDGVAWRSGVTALQLLPVDEPPTQGQEQEAAVDRLQLCFSSGDRLLQDSPQQQEKNEEKEDDERNILVDTARSHSSDNSQEKYIDEATAAMLRLQGKFLELEGQLKRIKGITVQGRAMSPDLAQVDLARVCQQYKHLRSDLKQVQQQKENIASAMKAMDTANSTKRGILQTAENHLQGALTLLESITQKAKEFQQNMVASQT